MDYDRIDAVNFSTLKHMERGPLYYQHALRTRTEPTATMRLGTAVHCMILEPEQFSARYCVADIDRRTKAGKEQAALEAEAGREVIKTAEYTEIMMMRDSLMANELAVELLTHSTTEAALTWTSYGGWDFKGRIDAFKLEPKPVLIDLKTTKDPQPWGFRKQFTDMLYHAQLAMYVDGLMSTHECDYPDVYVIAVGNSAPYETVAYSVPLPVLEQGERLVQKWLAELERCRKEDRFPSRYEGANVLELPAWALDDEDDDISLEGLERMNDDDSEE